MNAPARTMEIPSDMETYATADLTATMAVFIKYGVRMMSPDEIAEQLPAYPTAHLTTTFLDAGREKRLKPDM
jgi:hypothetical protein